MDELSKYGSKNFSKCDNFDEDIFDDSTFLENLERNDYKDTANDAKTDFNVSALCCDEELNGFDKLTGQTWIYPTNYPVRDYQFNIIKAAMLENCLVSLPTGLGKTFIAAVIMYNFYRWYPLGKIIFTAPTRPLVAQQIEACYNIVAIPTKDTIEMTGQMHVNTRKVHWQSKRVFFATPQVIYNDIKSGMCPRDKIRCLVFDEAHKARGNYAYGNIISTLSEMGHQIYRVLALSATPGNKVEDVIHVVKRLNISHLELRTENCLDVKVYSHARKINTVVVALGPELSRLQQQYVEILDGYNRKLKNYNIVQNLGNLTKGRIVMLYKEFQSRDRGARHPQHNNIMRTFTLLITLYHGLELLVKHGARVFLNFFDEHPEKTWVHFDKDLTSFFDKLRDQLGVNPLSLDRSILPDGTIPQIPSNLNFGHPKFDKLKEIMLEHFNIAKKNGQETKAIVFCEYRESVNLVHCLLLQCRPTIVPEMFVGHGSGKEGRAAVSERQRLVAMRRFRGGSCNALVCTCVAEEGLDVGAVDLILCFDVSTRSPVRLVQRCGRTGRERSGQVYILVTEGREHTTLLECMRQSDGLNKRILQSEEVKKNLYKFNPRMLPRDFMPECQKMYITVKKEVNEKEKKKKEKLNEKPKDKSKDKLQKGQQDLRSMFLNKASSSKPSERDTQNNEWITKEEFSKMFPRGYRECNLFSQPVEYWAMDKESFGRINKAEPHIKLSSHLKLQKKLQETYSIGHSSDSILLTDLLQHKSEFPINKSPVKRDGDIRVLFSKTTKSIKHYTKSMKELGINDNLNISTEVLNLLVDLSLENTSKVKPCYICLTVCNCSKFSNYKANKAKRPVAFCSRSQPILPDINLLDNINLESLAKLADENEDIKKDSNTCRKNILSESFPALEYSNSSNLDNVEMLNKLMDNIENNVHLKSTGNYNIFEDDCLFEENIDMSVNLTPTKLKLQLDDIQTNKRVDESNISDLKTVNEISGDNIKFQKSLLNTVVVESQEICENDNIFDEVFEDIYKSFKSPNKSRHLKYPTDKVDTIEKSSEFIAQDSKNKNNYDCSHMESENDDTIIIDSQDICENENIFEDNDVFEVFETPVKVTPAESRLPKKSSDYITNIRRTTESYQNSNTGNKYNTDNIEQENNTIFEDSEVMDDIVQSVNMKHSESKQVLDNVHSDKSLFGKNNQDIKTFNENKNEINKLESHIDDDIFSDDDIFDDVEIQTNRNDSESKLQLNEVVTATERTSETIIQEMDSTNDIYTVSVLKYFHLKKISDIFQDSEVDIHEEEKKDNININNVSLMAQNKTNYNQQCNDNNQINVIPLGCPSSPSLLSGRSISDRSTSPILVSQKRKTNLSIKKRKKEVEKTSLFDNEPNHKTNFVQKIITLSPLSEPEHRKTMKSLQQDINEIIVLDSDDEIFVDNPTKDCNKQTSNTTIKRKISEEPNMKSESPYFRKKLKLNEKSSNSKPSTIKEKIIAALTSNQNPGNSFHNNTQINFMTSTSPTLTLKKENRDPLSGDELNSTSPKSKIDMLNRFRHKTDNKSRALHEREVNVPKKITFYHDEDDDFKTELPYRKKVLKLKNERIANAKKVSDFIDVEAELSQEGSASADERSDDSAGSLVDFICDEAPEEDIHDIYLQSVKSPVKGVFKVPQLPPLNRAEVLSQYVEDDTYEMDSFCVDSHIILNETHEMSELEVAEMILKERRKAKKKQNQKNTQKDGEGSPIIRKNNRNVKRQINSDSEDSS